MSGVHATLHGLGFKILPLSESIGEKALTLIQEHAHADGLHLTDALIAATAIEAGEGLATSNVRYFRVIHSLEVKAFHPSARGSH
jgi:predicted nucleic acid-binding protein